jgi:hypothetical protein
MASCKPKGPTAGATLSLNLLDPPFTVVGKTSVPLAMAGGSLPEQLLRIFARD